MPTTSSVTSRACRCRDAGQFDALAALGQELIELHTLQIVMSNKLFVEQREQGDYAVRKPGSSRASAVAPTQREAIKIAQRMGAGRPDVERVRHTTRGQPDQWRKA